MNVGPALSKARNVKCQNQLEVQHPMLSPHCAKAQLSGASQITGKKTNNRLTLLRKMRSHCRHVWRLSMHAAVLAEATSPGITCAAVAESHSATQPHLCFAQNTNVTAHPEPTKDIERSTRRTLECNAALEKETLVCWMELCPKDCRTNSRHELADDPPRVPRRAARIPVDGRKRHIGVANAVRK